MKTYRDLYTQVHAFENLYLAYRKARKGKRGAIADACRDAPPGRLYNLAGRLQNTPASPDWQKPTTWNSTE